MFLVCAGCLSTLVASTFKLTVASFAHCWLRRGAHHSLRRPSHRNQSSGLFFKVLLWFFFKAINTCKLLHILMYVVQPNMQNSEKKWLFLFELVCGQCDTSVFMCWGQISGVIKAEICSYYWWATDARTCFSLITTTLLLAYYVCSSSSAGCCDSVVSLKTCLF